jgi:hypothetical protein
MCSLEPDSLPDNTAGHAKRASRRSFLKATSFVAAGIATGIATLSGVQYGQALHTTSELPQPEVPLVALDADTIVLTGKGIDATGVGDSTRAIQAVLEHAPKGSHVFLPQGTYQITETLRITTRIHLHGPGTLNFVAGIENSPGLLISANDCVVAGLTLTNPNLLGAKTGRQSYGIMIRANGTTISGCTVDSWQGGVAVGADGEWTNHRIHNNRIKDIIGAGDGPTDSSSTYGEDRGDGITIWGAQATISGNIINCKVGSDGRIGIHAEALSAFQGPLPTPQPAAMVTISGNIVYGKFRRGISSEGMTGSVIVGNTVADSTWWSLSLARGSAECVVEGNTVIWTRQKTDMHGQAWAPRRAPLMLYGSVAGCIVRGNTVTVRGAATAGMFIQGIDSNTFPSDCIVDGNVFRHRGEARVRDGISLDLRSTGIKIVNNIIDGFSEHGVHGSGSTHADIRGNTLTGQSGAFGIKLANDETNLSSIASENTISGCKVGISRPKSQNNQFSGNVIEGGTIGIDLRGCANSTAIGNVYANVTIPVARTAGSNIVTEP